MTKYTSEFECWVNEMVTLLNINNTLGILCWEILGFKSLKTVNKCNAFYAAF